MDTKTDFNLNNVIATLSLISISSIKQFAGKCPDTCSARWMPKLVSIDAQSYAALTSQSLRAIIGPMQDNWSLFHYVIGILGILPYNRNVTLQTLELFSVYARLYNAAASPVSRLQSAGSLAIIFKQNAIYGLQKILLDKFPLNFYIWSAIVNGVCMQKNQDRSPSKISS